MLVRITQIRYFLVTFLFLQTITASAQIKPNSAAANPHSMNSKFDLETYNKNKQGGQYIFQKNGVTIKQTDFADGFSETVTRPDSYIEHYKEFYKNTLLKAEGNIFRKGEFEVGIWYFYNEYGQQQKTVNYDEPYKFTLEKALEFLKKNDLSLKDKWTSINRQSDTVGNVWIISHANGHEDVNIILQHIHLDATNGKVLSTKTSKHPDN
jgi:hypothetical protein